MFMRCKQMITPLVTPLGLLQVQPFAIHPLLQRQGRLRMVVVLPALSGEAILPPGGVRLLQAQEGGSHW